MKNKKGIELTLNVIVVAAMVLIVLFISIKIYRDKMGENIVNIDGVMVNMNKDCDGDKVNNMFDKCPCVPGENEYSGCPVTFEDTDDLQREQLPCIKSPCVS